MSTPQPPLAGPCPVGVLHAVLPAGAQPADAVGLWLEGPGPFGGGGAAARTARVSPTAHPAAAALADVASAAEAAIPGLAQSGLTAGGLASSASGRSQVARSPAVLYLPSAGPRPRPSPEAARLAGAALGSAGEPRLRPWSTPVLWLPTDRFTASLWRLAAADASGEAAVLAPDVAWLGRLARLAAQHWLTGAVVPRVDAGTAGVAAAYWLPILDDAELRPALEALVRAMPISLLAAARPNTWAGQRDGRRWQLASELLGDMVDALARYTPTRTGATRRPPQARLRPRRLKRQTSAWGEVARSLGTETPLLYASGSDPLSRVAARLAAWQAPADGRGARVARLSLHLSPPARAGRAGGRRAAAAGAEWRLAVAVGLIGHGAEAVPVGELFATSERGARAAKRLGLPLADLVRVVQGDLARIAQFAPQAASMVRRAVGGGGTGLSAAETLRLLQVDGPRLRQAGFIVAVPDWWRQDARRRLRVDIAATAPAGGRGRLGLGAVTAIRWRARAGEEGVSAADLAQAVGAGGGLLRVGGGWVEVSERDARILARLLAAAPRESGEVAERDLLELFAELAGDEADEGDAAVEVEAEGWLREARAAIEEGRPALGVLPPLPLGPGDIHGRLRPYQEDGVRWLWSLASRGMGACLADDMGLGKTVQAIALIVARRRAGMAGANAKAVQADEGTQAGGRYTPPTPPDAAAVGPLPVLLICPTSVLTNWQREFARFAPELAVGVRHGTGRARGADAAAGLAQSDIVLTSYSLVWRDHRVLAQVAWDGVILDEAQAVKNPSTRQSRAVRRLSGRYRLALTGTPVENRLLDLWSIFQFLNPGYLGSAERFRQRFGQPVEERGDQSASAALHRLVAPFILRRLKSDPRVVADLPPKVEMRELCALTREQARLYQGVVDDMLRRVARLEGMERRGAVATAILRLKQVLNHPSHFLRDGGSFRPERSGKLTRVGQIVEEALSEGDRLLLFTQFVAFGNLVRPYLEELAGAPVPFLHGGLSRSERDRAIATFQAEGGPPLFLLSLKAGGVGLNLTRANRVLHLDRWWNPAVEEQATDRAHRIGQRERVMVHKLVVAGTIEERVDSLLEEKRDLAARVVGTSGESWLGDLDDDTLADLVRLRAAEVEP